MTDFRSENWHVEWRPGHAYDGLGRATIRTEAGERVAVASLNGAPNGDKELSLRNAHLIAAAPDLLAACEKEEEVADHIARCPKCWKASNYAERCPVCHRLQSEATLLRRAALGKVWSGMYHDDYKGLEIDEAVLCSEANPQMYGDS